MDKHLTNQKHNLPLRMSLGLISIIFLALLTGCNFPGSAADASPTPNITQAYQTVNAKLTQAIALTPSPQASPSLTVTATNSPTPTLASTNLTPASPSATIPVQPGCDLAAPGNPIDVTIPDDTLLKPGQTYTKIWRLQNIGTCTWTKAYALGFFSGERMNAPQLILLPQDIPTGGSIDLAVDMIAPQNPGTYQGNWKLRSASGNWFGIGPNGDSPFWVRIIVEDGATTPTPTVTVTQATASLPPVIVNGLSTLLPADKIDLDTNQINNADPDLSYEVNFEGKHLLIPLGNVVMSVYGATQPNYAACQSASLSASPLIVENLAPGTFLCYRTNQGMLGRSLVTVFNQSDATLTMEILTWGTP